MSFLTPREFDFTKPQDWKQWMANFEKHFTLFKNWHKLCDRMKITTLLYVMGEKSSAVIAQIVPEGIDDTTSYEDVKSRLEAYFCPKRNSVNERMKFYKRRQREGECNITFLKELYELTNWCEFGRVRGDVVLDHMISGLRDTALAEFFKSKPCLLLTNAVVMLLRRSKRPLEVKKERNQQDFTQQYPEVIDEEADMKDPELEARIAAACNINLSLTPSLIGTRTMSDYEIHSSLRFLHNFIMNYICLGDANVAKEHSCDTCRGLPDARGLGRRDHRRIIRMLQMLSDVFYEDGKCDLALKLCDDGLVICKNIDGEVHADVREFYTRVGKILSKKGEFDEAEPFFRKALKIAEKEWGCRSIHIVPNIKDLALGLENQGKFFEAEDCYKWAIDVFKASGEHHEAEETRKELVNCNKKKCRFIISAQRSEIMESTLDHEISEPGRTIIKFATQCEEEGRYVVAASIIEDLLWDLTKTAGLFHKDLLTLLCHVISIYRRWRNYDKSTACILRVVHYRESMLGMYHNSNMLYYKLGLLVTADQGHFNYALALGVRLVENYSDFIGRDHPSVARLVIPFAMVCHLEENYVFAEKAYKVVLQIYKINFGSHDLLTIETQKKIDFLKYLDPQLLKARKR